MDKYLGLVNRSNTEGSETSSVSSTDQHDISAMISNQAKPEIINDVFDKHESVQPKKSGSLKTTRLAVQCSNTARTLESRSLDNLLEIRRPQTQSQTKKRLGSKKCYVNQPKTKDIFVNGIFL